MDDDASKVMVLRRREACPVPTTIVGRTTGREKVPKGEYKAQEEEYEKEKRENGVTAGGYLIGRHRECGMW
jgi:serine/threonine-protein kinase Chk2